MSFQRCPCCEGNGFQIDGRTKCAVCNGMRIIDASTGMPPKEPKAKVTEPVDPSTAFAQGHVLDEMSNEEILYWASPYFDELQAQKEAKKKRIEEESVGEEHA